MHLEILVEDQSGKRALDILIPKIIGSDHTFRVVPYKGIGRIPSNMGVHSDARKRILLDRLPQLLRGYGKTFFDYGGNYSAAVILICDLDDRCLKSFRMQLLAILDSCSPRPKTRFCIAIEEGEAWFLGDLTAVRAAYPKAKNAVLQATGMTLFAAHGSVLLMRYFLVAHKLYRQKVGKRLVPRRQSGQNESHLI